MEKEMSNIIYDYQKSNKEIDFNFITKIITLANKYYDLNNYILKTEIRNNPNMPQAQYNINSKEIYVYPESIYRIILELNNEFQNLKSNKFFSYIYATKILLHEVEHAYQHKKIKELNDIESEILRAEYNLAYKIMKSNILTRIPKTIYYNCLKNKYYCFSPAERLAEHTACEGIEKLAIIMEEEESYDMIQHFKYWNVLRGYNVGLINDLSDAPTKTYLKKINPKYDYSIIENLGNNIKQSEKMRFGLETSREELNKTAQEWQLVYKKIKNNRN